MTDQGRNFEKQESLYENIGWNDHELERSGNREINFSIKKYTHKND